MSLLREIQDGVIDPKVDIVYVLRKCKVLASRLRSSELGKWVDLELNGYTERNDLPDYRIGDAQSKGHFTGPGGSSLRNADIPLSCIKEEYRDVVSKTYFMEPISAYVDILNGPDRSGLQQPWPPDLVAHVAGDIYHFMNCMQAWKVIPRGAIVGLVDAVRNRVLNFVLELEAESPSAGEGTAGTAEISSRKVNQVFHTHIYGNVGNISEGSQDVRQSASMSITTNDVSALKSYLKSIGIPEDRITDLQQAIEIDPKKEVIKTKRLGPRVASWVGSLVSDVTMGLIPVIQMVDANLITQAIFMYYGIK